MSSSQHDENSSNLPAEVPSSVKHESQASSESQPGSGSQPNTESQADRQAQAEEPEISLLAEFVLFLRENKAWWIVPIVLALTLIGVAIWMSSATLAPFIYPTF